MVSASMRTSPMRHWHGGPSMSLSPTMLNKLSLEMGLISCKTVFFYSMEWIWFLQFE